MKVSMMLVAVVFGAVVMLAVPSEQARISLFEDKWQKKSVGDADVNGCYTMPAWQNKKVSSVNTHGQCFKLYEHGECNGARVTISNGGGDCSDHGNLDTCGFNDRATSIGNC